MSNSRRTGRGARLRFWLQLPVFPIAFVQGKIARKTIPTLSEAAGPRTGVVNDANAASSDRAPFSLAMLGESTAVGVGVERQEEGLGFYLAHALSKKMDRAVELQIVGKNGVTLEQIRRSFVDQIAFPVDAVVVILGVNDTTGLTRGSKWASGIASLTHELEARGAGAVLFSPVPPLGRFPSLPRAVRSMLGPRVDYLDAILEDVCGKEGAHYLAAELPDAPGVMSHDGFHPSAKGYALWAEALTAAWNVEKTRG